MTAHRLPPRLLALTTGADEARSFDAIARAVEAGLEGVLVRETAWTDRALLAFCERLRTLSPDLWIGVHDRVGIAVSDAIDAVHLGFRSLSPTIVRAMLPGDTAVGFSAHAGDPEGARDGADYLFLGPVYDTPSKADVVETLGIESFREACARDPRPVWALGGVTPERARACLEAGATGVAALSGILGATDPGGALRDWLGVTENAS